MRAVGYLRGSGERPNGCSPKDQEDRLRRWASYKGAELVDVFGDDEASARSRPEDRRGLSQALEAVRSGKADALAFAKLDRLARSVVVWGRLAQLSLEEGWALVCLDPEFDTSTDAGRIVAGVFASAAQWELEDTVERLQSGRDAKARRGGFLGGLAPYGFRWVDGKLRPDPETFEVFKAMHVARAMGRSFREIAEGLEADGVPPPSGERWYPSTVQRILRRKGER